MQETFFIYDRSAVVKQSFITELNKFLPIYYLVSNFSEKKGKNKIVSSQNRQKFFIEKTTEKDNLSLQITKVSRKEIQTTDNTVHNFQIAKIGKKRKQKMNVVDFISVRRQQQFEENADINPIEIKIENEKIQLMLQKYNKYIIRFKLESPIFSSSIKNNTEKIFLVTNGLSNAKY